MQKQDWEKLGDDIRRTVQEAIDSQDFHQLNQTIKDTVNSTMESVSSEIKSVGSEIKNVAKNVAKESSEALSGRNAVKQDSTKQTIGQSQKQLNKLKNKKLFAKPVGTKTGGILLTVFGGIFGLSSALVILILLIYILVTGIFGGAVKVSLILMGVFAILGCGLLTKGITKIGKVRRFCIYQKQVSKTDYCDIKELSESVRKPSKKVLNDLDYMIEKGWFKEGHLDEQRTCLIVSNDAFNEYKKMIEAQRIKEENERISREKEVRMEESASPQVRDILKTGNEYIKRIHDCNDAIEGIEISGKISRMEALIDSIFERIEQDPSVISGIRKMMDYYLPMTVKLLKAYEQLEQQPVQGENIISSKREIEETLDTLNGAFEKLLDDLFQKTAWDVSSDISVLNTMLAQEGLGQEDFK